MTRVEFENIKAKMREAGAAPRRVPGPLIKFEVWFRDYSEGVDGWTFDYVWAETARDAFYSRWPREIRADDAYIAKNARAAS